MKRLLRSFLSVMCITALSFAQTRQITGKVIGSDNQSVISASGKVKGGTTSAITNADGQFSIKVPAGKVTLVVS